MKRHVRICVMLICMLLLCGLFSTQIFAATTIDSNHPVTLQIIYKYDDRALSNAHFDIYHIAYVDKNGKVTPSENFALFNMDVYDKNDAELRVLSGELEEYVKNNNIVPTDYGKTDESGNIVFPNNINKLEQGIYLVVGHDLVKGYDKYETSSFMISLPTIDKNGNMLYYVTAEPKADCTLDFYLNITPDDGTNSGANPDMELLPQTGQLWWPVPILVFLGIAFIIVGIIFNRGLNDEN